MCETEVDIEELHQQALQIGSTTYIDPATGFTVFTELAHLRRGKCCGNRCRHCPYGWANVVSDTQKKQQRHRTVVSSNNHAPSVSSKSVTSEAETTTDTSQAPAATKSGGRHGGRYTTKNVPYTRSGDKGTSQLLTGERRFKDDQAFEAMGTVDELCSVVGVVHAELTANVKDDGQYRELPEWLLEVMSRLFDIGSHVAKPRKRLSKEDDDEDDDDESDEDVPFETDGVGGGFHISHIDQLEDWIDIMTDELPELSSFVLPTGGKGAAQLHVARTVCRRAERRVIGLVEAKVCDPNAMRYLNRLSDFFFTAARWVNYLEGRDEIQYRRESRGAKQRNRVAVSLNGNNNEAK